MEQNSDAKFSIFFRDSEFILTEKKEDSELVYSSTDGINFSPSEKKALEKQKNFFEVPNYESGGEKIAFTEKKGNIFIQRSQDGSSWEDSEIVISPRREYFDNDRLSIGCAGLEKEGIYAIYYTNRENSYKFGALLFDRDDPEKLLHRTDRPVWKFSFQSEKHELLGCVYRSNKIYVYWQTPSGVQASVIPFCIDETFGIVEKSSTNPIISPTDNDWECDSTFNPAAFEHEGKVHILYRAIGRSNISVLGHAISLNGKDIFKRSRKPVYTHNLSGPITRDLSGFYLSGRQAWRPGSFGGCEDPRITKIEDRLVMLYTAFEGYPRVALTHISISDFLKGKNSWSKPSLTQKDKIHKNWVMFPEKINGRYAILHSISPKVEIDYLDELSFHKPIESVHIKIENDEAWHNVIRGVGPPPIKTNKGWLVFYHAHSKGEYGKYKLGALLLDLKNPKKILHKSAHPIIVPSLHYENIGFKPGVIYCCGAIVLKGELFIYYGGADSVACVARKNLDSFLEQLTSHKQIDLTPVEIQPK